MPIGVHATAREQARLAEERVADRLDAPGRPGRTVLQHWRNLRTGAVSVAVLFFDARVRQAVGTRYLAAAVADQRLNLQDAEPVVVGEETTPAGTLVTLEAYEADSPPGRYSYLLRRRDGRWLVVFDTLTQSTLEGHPQKRFHDSLDPDAGGPSARAAGASAAERYITVAFTLANGEP